MGAFRQFIGRMRLQVQGKHHIVGWGMTPEQAVSFIRSRGKVVLTFFGYSGMGYEDEKGMLETARRVMSGYLPEKTLINIGVTEVGIGGIYPLAKSKGFETSGVVTTIALAYPQDISGFVDHICFIKDNQWGGKLPGSTRLSPTSRAMVECSDILVAIGGRGITTDEVLEGRRQGKPIQYFPAEMNHEAALRHARDLGQPPPDSFWGSMPSPSGEKQSSSTSSAQTQD